MPARNGHTDSLVIAPAGGGAELYKAEINLNCSIRTSATVFAKECPIFRVCHKPETSTEITAAAVVRHFTALL